MPQGLVVLSILATALSLRLGGEKQSGETEIVCAQKGGTCTCNGKVRIGAGSTAANYEGWQLGAWSPPYHLSGSITCSFDAFQSTFDLPGTEAGLMQHRTRNAQSSDDIECRCITGVEDRKCEDYLDIQLRGIQGWESIAYTPASTGGHGWAGRPWIFYNGEWREFCGGSGNLPYTAKAMCKALGYDTGQMFKKGRHQLRNYTEGALGGIGYLNCEEGDDSLYNCVWMNPVTGKTGRLSTGDAEPGHGGPGEGCRADDYGWGTHLECWDVRAKEGKLYYPIQSCVVPTLTGHGHGDPHLRNIKGEDFDVMQEGNMLLLETPRQSSPGTLNFALHADINRFGATLCGPTYITAIQMDGSWLGCGVKISSGKVFQQPSERGDSERHAFGIRLGDDPFWSHVTFISQMQGYSHLPGGASIQGHDRTFIVKAKGLTILVSQPKRPRVFLDVQVTGLETLTGDVGGLLGIDDHSHAEELPEECK